MSMGSRLSLLGLYNMDNTLFNEMVLPEDFTNDDIDVLLANILMECAELEVLYPNATFMKDAIGAWSAKEVITWDRIYKASILEYNPIENYNRIEKINIQNRGAMTHSGTDSVAGSGNDSDVATGYNSIVGSGNTSDVATGNTSDVATGNTSDVSTGTDTITHSIASFDSNTYQPKEQTTDGKGTTITHNRNDTITHNRNDTITHNRNDTETHNFNNTVTHNHGITDTTTYGHVITDTTGSQTTSQMSGNIGTTTSQQMLESELELAPKINTFNFIIESFRNRFCLLVY